jgi:hypothetical protein
MNKDIHYLDAKSSCYYLLENNKILSCEEYWELDKRTHGNHSPAIRSSLYKQVLVELARKRKREQYER